MRIETRYLPLKLPEVVMTCLLFYELFLMRLELKMRLYYAGNSEFKTATDSYYMPREITNTEVHLRSFNSLHCFIFSVFYNKLSSNNKINTYGTTSPFKDF